MLICFARDSLVRRTTHYTFREKSIRKRRGPWNPPLSSPHLLGKIEVRLQTDHYRPLRCHPWNVSQCQKKCIIAPGHLVNLNTTILIFQHLNLRYFVEFPRRVNEGTNTFLLSDPIFDNDFMPKRHWEMLTALSDLNINARPFVYIQMGIFAAT